MVVSMETKAFLYSFLLFSTTFYYLLQVGVDFLVIGNKAKRATTIGLLKSERYR